MSSLFSRRAFFHRLSEKKMGAAVLPGLRVYGLLITEDGRPVPGATVTIDNYPDVEMSRRAVEGGYDDTKVKELEFSTISDQQGRFDFKSVPYVSWRGMFDFRFRLWSRHGGLSAGEHLDLTPDSCEQYRELVMTPDGLLTALVTDMQGVPIDGTFVYICDVQGRKDMNVLPRTTTRTYTGKDGRFTFEFLPPGSYRVEINADGFSPLQTPWVASGDPDLVFQLEIGNTISGRVVEAATGKALPHVGVFAQEHVAPNAPWRNAHADTDESGQFTIAGFDSGTYLLSVTQARGKSDVPYALQEPVSVTLQPGQPVTGVELRAILGTSVSGHVIEAATGRPLQRRVHVTAEPTEGIARERERIANVEKDGSYTIYGFLPGKFVLKAFDRARAYPTVEKAVTISGTTPVTGVDFSLAKPDKDQALTGKVIDKAGAPVEGASVVAVSPYNRYAQGSALTDAEGEFAISILYDPPKTVYVQAFMRGAMSRRAGPMAPLGGSCTLQLEPAGRIEGVVVDESGEPFPGVTVGAIGEEDTASILANGAPGRAMERIRGTKAGTSDSGAFLMPYIRAGSYRLEVYAPAASIDVPIAKGHAQVRAGETLRTRLVVDTQGLGTIEGTITTNGAPVQDSRVYATSGESQWMSSVQDITDPSGHYVLPHVQPGKAKVTAWITSSGHTGANFVQRTQIVDVAAGQTVTVDFSLGSEKHGAVEGYVYINGVPSNSAIVAFQVAGAEETDANITAVTNQNGWFQAEGLEEGSYISEASYYMPNVASPLRLNDVQEISVKAGETARIDFHLNSGRVEGMVSGIPKGEQAFVSLLDGSVNIFSLTPQVLQSMEERVLAVMSVPQDGPFTFELIPEGNYVLGAVSVPKEASQQDIAPAIAAITAGKYTAAEIQVVAGETTSADLPLP